MAKVAAYLRPRDYARAYADHFEAQTADGTPDRIMLDPTPRAPLEKRFGTSVAVTLQQ